MSGIFGIIKNKYFEVSKIENVKKMHQWNRAYGRSKEELFQTNYACLGCCLETLSSTTISGSPIIKNEPSYAAIDALLYNRDELEKKCPNAENLSDEELLFSYTNTLSMDSLSEVNGDFSGALYNSEKHQLTLFRDHMGIRPLYYYADNDQVAFSTDLRGLLALETIDSSINEDWIYRTLAGYYLDGVIPTEYKHIFCIPPASYVIFSFSGDKLHIDSHTYWRLGQKKLRLSSFDAYKHKLNELVTDSIRRRLNAVSAPVGAELSGGLDSGVIDILIHRLGKECNYFSWSVDPKEVPYAKDDERLVIKDICDQENISCNFSHMQANYGLDSNIAQEMNSLGFSLNPEEPPALRYAFPPYINALTLCTTCEHMKQNNVKVIFSGHGGDEGISHRCNPYELFYHHEYYHFFQHMWSTTRGQKRRPIKTLKACKRQLVDIRQRLTGVFHMPFGAPELLNKNFANRFSEKDMPSLHFAYSPNDYIMEGGSRNRLDNVALIGAYNGIRYLIPYLDYRVIDFAVSIPRHLYLHGSENRYLFREAFKDIMPESLYTLQHKEDNSHKNYPDNPDWYLEFAKRKSEVYQKLDRTFWQKYLDFDFIDTWMKKGKPSDNERRHDNNILMCLFYCAMAQNAIDKAKDI